MFFTYVLTLFAWLAIIVDVSCAKNTKNLILKVEARRAALVQGVQKTHANSHRICVHATQKDCSGCGACRMATVYRTLNCVNTIR